MCKKYINGTIKAAFFACFFSLISCAGNNKSNITKEDLVKKIFMEIEKGPDYRDNKIPTEAFKKRVKTFFENSHNISDIEKSLKVKKEEKFSGAFFESESYSDIKNYYTCYFDDKFGITLDDNEPKIFQNILKKIKKELKQKALIEKNKERKKDIHFNKEDEFTVCRYIKETNNIKRIIPVEIKDLIYYYYHRNINPAEFILLNTLRGHRYRVTSVLYSPNGKYIASGSEDGTVKIWDAETGSLVTTLKGHEERVTSVIYSPDGKYIISGSWDKTIIIWDVKTGKKLKVLTGSDLVNSLSYSPDGNKIASGSRNKTIIIWDINTGKKLNTLRVPGRVSSLSYSPNGKYITSGNNDRTIIIWDAKTGKKLKILRVPVRVSSLSYSPNGKYIISGSKDGTIIIWDAKTGEKLKIFQHSGNVTSVIYSPNGNKIASGSDDGSVIIWNTKTLEKLKTLKWPSGDITSLSFNRDENIAGGGRDSNIKIWGMPLVVV